VGPGLQPGQFAASILQCKAADVIGHPASEAISCWPTFQAFCAPDSPRRGEVRLDGSREHYIDLEITPLDSQQGVDSGLLLILHDVTEARQREAEKERLVKELQAALAQVKQLSGLLPVCASCKKIRDEQDEWHSLEAYIHEHSNAQFTHGL
jgi:hypothetical protein